MIEIVCIALNTAVFLSPLLYGNWYSRLKEISRDTSSNQFAEVSEIKNWAFLRKVHLCVCIDIVIFQPLLYLSIVKP